MARILSPHVVRILDAGTDHEGPFLVMERVRGETLFECLNRVGKLSPLAVMGLGDQILAGLAAAHHAGVIHRDLKPENILLAENGAGQGVAKIADFGISRIEMVDEHTLTQPDQFVGTANYLAPEQIRKDPITHRADLWSAGVLLYQCLTGRRPFEADGVYALYSRILSERHAPLPIDAASAAAFEPFFERALAKKALARFSSAEEMRAALSKLRRAFLAAPSKRPSSRAVFMAIGAIVATAAGIAGAATGRALANPAAVPVTDTFALDVAPTGAQVLVDGRPIVDRNSVSMSSPLLHVAAAGFRARDVEVPTRGGGKLVVELVPDPALVATTPSSPPPTTRMPEPAAESARTALVGARMPSPPPRRVSRPAPPAPPPPVASGARGAVKPIAVPPY